MSAPSAVLTGSPPIASSAGPAPARAAPAAPEDAPLPIPKIRDVVRIWVLYAHHISGGNKRVMAEALGVSMKTVYNKIALYRRQGWLA